VDELKIKLADIGTDPDLIPKIGEAVFLGKAAKTGDAKMFATVAAITQRHTELKSRQGEHADKMKIADKRLKLQAANLDRQNKELQSRLDELDRQRKAAEAAITKANKDGGMTDETVKVIRQALGMKTDEA
jgi:seryl-tRNA synthetase